ncbi:MAG TPA: HNH endonuclease signature motif containing protein [bacterium]|nr:HNH endonuclease signature motif containing protein [bacterium]
MGGTSYGIDGFRGLRRLGTDRSGKNFSKAVVDAVWEKGLIVPGVDPNVRRRDQYGSLIDYSQYGATVQNGTGWEIDHIVPVAKWGADQLSNLQPLQWENNRRKGDS